jgi:precorrin-3B methylase
MADEQIRALAEVDPAQVDTRTVMIIGSSQTRIIDAT